MGADLVKGTVMDTETVQRMSQTIAAIRADLFVGYEAAHAVPNADPGYERELAPSPVYVYGPGECLHLQGCPDTEVA